jgi:hypothetical protein
MGEPEIIARADLNTINPNTHVVIGHTANLGGSSVTLGFNFSRSPPKSHQEKHQRD